MQGQCHPVHLQPEPYCANSLYFHRCLPFLVELFKTKNLMGARYFRLFISQRTTHNIYPSNWLSEQLETCHSFLRYVRGWAQSIRPLFSALVLFHIIGISRATFPILVAAKSHWSPVRTVRRLVKLWVLCFKQNCWTKFKDCASAFLWWTN